MKRTEVRRGDCPGFTDGAEGVPRLREDRLRIGTVPVGRTEDIRTKKQALSLFSMCLHLIMGFLLLATYVPFTFASQTADEEVAKIQKAYANIKDISGSFTQRSYVKDLKRTDKYTGQFLIKPPKMAWEYKGDKPHVYINGDTIIIYQKKEKQAFKAKFDRNTYGQAPIALLGGMGDISREFNVSMGTVPDLRRERSRYDSIPSGVVESGLSPLRRLILKPKKPMGNISHIELSISDDKFPIESLAIIDSLSNRIDISFSGIKINTGLSDSIFEFSPPAGVNIIQQ